MSKGDLFWWLFVTFGFGLVTGMTIAGILLREALHTAIDRMVRHDR